MEILLYLAYALQAALAFVLLYLLAVIVSALLVDQSKPIEKQSRFFRGAVNNIITVFCALWGLRAKVSGLEKMPEGKFLMVCNHRSMFDPLTTICKFKKYNVAYISKPENLRIPVVGGAIFASGSLAIDRENNREALKTIIRAAEHIKSGLCNMMIYPEGTRSRDGKLLPFHAGSFKIAQRAGCDLVICAISGSEKVTKRIFRPTKVEMAVLETVPADKVKSMSTDELAQYSFELISGWLSEKEKASL